MILNFKCMIYNKYHHMITILKNTFSTVIQLFVTIFLIKTELNQKNLNTYIHISVYLK